MGIDEDLRRLNIKPGEGSLPLPFAGAPQQEMMQPPALASELHMTCNFSFGDEAMFPAGLGIARGSSPRNRMLLMRTTGRLGEDVMHLFFLDVGGFGNMLAHIVGACDEEYLEAVERLVAERRAFLAEHQVEAESNGSERKTVLPGE